MYSFICPSGNLPCIVIYVGDASYSPDVNDLTFIRDKLEENRSLLDTIHEWYPGTVQVQFIPECSPDREYVYMFNCLYEYAEEDIKSYQELFKKSINDPNYIIFTHCQIEIKRIGKVLLPFL